MPKIILNILYGVATFTGVAGLFAGGVPLTKYALEILRDSEYLHYYDRTNLNESEMIFLLSLILLIGVRICSALENKTRPANPSDAASSGEKPVVPAPSKEISPLSGAAKTPSQPMESADDKLTRLLNEKKD